MKDTNVADVGVIVGRFQVHELHEMHRELINTVKQRHQKVLIFIGLSPLRGTSKNPLDFSTRRKMIQEAYPDIDICYINDCPTDEEWSKNLDREISRNVKPSHTVMLYGSRDSFIPHYKGKHPTTELEPTKYISGSEQRRRVSLTNVNNKDFRMGVISSSFDRFETSYPTVDIAVIDPTRLKLLLGQKAGEIGLRFIGGFASPASKSYEDDAKREVLEETGIEIGDPIYLGSSLIDDWRYRGEVDKIKTLFFVGYYQFGAPQAKDDIEFVQWVTLVDFMNGKVSFVPEHEVLADMLEKFVAKTFNLNS